jgi:hypothetical protein
VTIQVMTGSGAQLHMDRSRDQDRRDEDDRRRAEDENGKTDK